MTTRLPDANDVADLRALTESTPPGRTRDVLEQRLRGLTELVEEQTPVEELPFDPAED